MDKENLPTFLGGEDETCTFVQEQGPWIQLGMPTQKGPALIPDSEALHTARAYHAAHTYHITTDPPLQLPQPSPPHPTHTPKLSIIAITPIIASIAIASPLTRVRLSVQAWNEVAWGEDAWIKEQG